MLQKASEAVGKQSPASATAGEMQAKKRKVTVDSNSLFANIETARAEELVKEKKPAVEAETLQPPVHLDVEGVLVEEGYAEV